jgi:sortase (surface protein transpeptidase)
LILQLWCHLLPVFGVVRRASQPQDQRDRARGAADHRRRRLALDAAIALLAVLGVTLVVIGGGAPERNRADTAEAATVAQGPPGPPSGIGSTTSGAGAATTSSHQGLKPGGAQAALGRSEPVHLAIPAIGVSTGLVPLGLNQDGTIAVPPLGRAAPAGWYRYLATPGEVGPAVILGHVDSARDGPAVFYRLIDLRAGDQVSVRRADGQTAVFTVTRVEEYAKSHFPTGAVYGAQGHPELRLVTCGGEFDKVHRQYRGNVVVYATFTASTA